MRPIVWGFTLSALGAFFWILFSIAFGIVEELSGIELGEVHSGLIELTGLAMIIGIPAGILGEIARWRNSKKTIRPHPPTIPNSVVYCHQCGKPSQSSLSLCGHCGSKL